VERCRLAVRTSGFVVARGRLEHREGTINLLVSRIERLERADLPPTQPRHIAPPTSRETGREQGHRIGLEGAAANQPREGVDKPWRGTDVNSELYRPGREQIVAELTAALPAPHSFGRRGR
jgi:hypothetical protein